MRYITSWHVMDNDIYSASHVESATDACFFDFKLIDGPSSFKHRSWRGRIGN